MRHELLNNIAFRHRRDCDDLILLGSSFTLYAGPSILKNGVVSKGHHRGAQADEHFCLWEPHRVCRLGTRTGRLPT